MDNMLRTAIAPMGTTMYIWGGAWNEEDTIPTLTQVDSIVTPYSHVCSIVLDPAGNMVTAAGTYVSSGSASATGGISPGALPSNPPNRTRSSADWRPWHCRYPHISAASAGRGGQYQCRTNLPS